VTTEEWKTSAGGTLELMLRSMLNLSMQKLATAYFHHFPLRDHVNRYNSL